MAAPNHQTQAERYQAALGEAARDRQERLAKERYVCCGMPKPDHHEMCPYYVPAETSVTEDQTSLL